MATTQRLRDRMIEDLVLRGMAPNTIETYVRCARNFAAHFGRSPRAMGATEIRTFLLHLVQERKLRPATFNVYRGALKFLYAVTLDRLEETTRMPRMRLPMHIPAVLTTAEVARLLAVLRKPKVRAMVMLAYGAGLRVSEVRNLRVDDIDPKRMLVRVQHTKRGRERFVMLSPRLLSTLREYWKAARPKGRVGRASAIRASSGGARPFAVTSPPVRYKVPSRLRKTPPHRRKQGPRLRAANLVTGRSQQQFPCNTTEAMIEVN